MNGLLNKISPNTKNLCVIISGCAVGFFVFKQEKFDFIFDLMDGFISYFGIMSSVSFAILAVLIQQFDRKSLETQYASEIKREAINAAGEMNVEVWRIVFMLLPVLAYFMMSFFNEHNRFGASLLAAITFIAIVFSIFLPFKYVSFIRLQLINAVVKKEDDEIKKHEESASDLLEEINRK